MTLLLENVKTPEYGQIDINVDLSTYIHVTPTQARRKVNVFVTHHIADLLHGEKPNLVWRGDGVFWRVPVALATPTKGRLGLVGAIDVDVQTGDLAISESTIENIEGEAQRLAENASL